MVAEAQPRRHYITDRLVKKYGATENCPGCLNKSIPHTEACRMRMMQKIGEDPLEKERYENRNTIEKKYEEAGVGSAVPSPSGTVPGGDAPMAVDAAGTTASSSSAAPAAPTASAAAPSAGAAAAVQPTVSTAAAATAVAISKAAFPTPPVPSSGPTAMQVSTPGKRKAAKENVGTVEAKDPPQRRLRQHVDAPLAAGGVSRR